MITCRNRFVVLYPGRYPDLCFWRLYFNILVQAEVAEGGFDLLDL